MEHLHKKYFEYQSNNLLRERIIYKPNSNTDFTTSDYLNIANSANIKKSLLDGFDKYGLGSKGSAVVCGYTQVTYDFENAFAKFVGYPKAIFFSSGFMANLAIYSTLFTKSDIIYADRNIHASIIDGIKLSQAKLKRYPHQNLEQLEKIYDNNSFITTEGIFSTTGSISDLKNISTLTNNLIVDEAHSFGILGEKGRGSISKHNLTNSNIPIAVYPLGKAFGSVGAVICTNEIIYNYLIQFAREYIYTTSLPPILIQANITQLENLKNADYQREKLIKNIKHFDKYCKKFNLEVTNSHISPIKSIVLNDTKLAIYAKNILAENGISVSCFRYPTVPQNQAMLRFSLHSNNTKSEIAKTIEILGNLKCTYTKT